MSLETHRESRLGFVRSYPADLGALAVLALIGFAVVWTQPMESVGRIAVAIAFVTFLPGYALVSVLFPARSRLERPDASTRLDRLPSGIDVAERLGLSFALSLVITAIVTLGLPFTEWGLTPGSVLTALTGVTILFSQLAVVRRIGVPEEDRFVVRPLSALAAVARGEKYDLTLSSIVLGVAVFAAVGMLVVALVSPLSTGGFTEMGLYTEDDDEFVAGNIPDEIEPGESIPLVVSVENQEGETTDYTIVVQEEVLEGDTVVDRTHHDEIDVTLEDGEREFVDYEVTPTADVDETVRVTFLLYQEETPIAPSIGSADQYTYFWVTTIEPEEDGEDDNSDGADEEDGS